MSISPQDAASCSDEFDPNSLTVEQAIERIERAVTPIEGAQRVALRESLDRVLAIDVAAPLDIPAFRNSAMDGYALQRADLQAGRDSTLRIVGASLAGHVFEGKVTAGQCVRITTGAVVPEGADAVVVQELVDLQGDTIVIPAGHEPRENVRHPGEDLRKGDTVLREGRRLNAADLGLLASIGAIDVNVRRRPVISFFSTGDELRGIGQPLAVGDIYDSNRYTLYGMLARTGAQIVDMGSIPDDPQRITEALRDAADNSDMIITSGGVSVGDADHIRASLVSPSNEEGGTIDFWKVAAKPGRPLVFGKVADTLFFGLPGNPVSVMATFMLFVRRAVQILSSESCREPLRLRATCLAPLKKLPGRKDYQRGILQQDATGRLTVDTTGLQGSHVLSSMSKANCFIVIPLEQGDVEAGSNVEVIPFEGLL